MSKIYENAAEADYALLTEVINETPVHARLRELGVKVKLVRVAKFSSSDELVPCLKHHGAQAAAVIRLTTQKERLDLAYDAEIILDAAIWRDADVRAQKALLDHELTHLTLKTNKAGVVKTADDGRPILRLIPDDFAITGFFGVAERHQGFAFELRSVTSVASKMGITGPSAADGDGSEVGSVADAGIPNP